MAVTFLPIEKVYDFEHEIESCAKTFLETDTGYSAQDIHTHLDPNEFSTPRLSVMFEVGGAVDPPDLKNLTSNELDYRKYTGNLTIQVVSDVSLDEQADGGSAFDSVKDIHRLSVARVRTSMRLSADNWTTTSNDNLVISGAGSNAVNGTYTSFVELNGKKLYTEDQNIIGHKVAYNNIGGGDNRWQIYYDAGLSQTLAYESDDDTTYPFDVTTWSAVSPDGSLPVPTVSKGKILKFLDVNYCRPAGTTLEVDGDLGITTLTYEMQFAIRNDAISDTA